MKKVLLAGAAFFISFNSALFSGNGTTSASFLDFGTGGLVGSPGNNYILPAREISVLSWNPAGFGLLNSKELNLIYLSYIQDITYNYLVYAQPVTGLGTLGAGITRLDYGKIKRTSEDENGEYTEVNGDFGATDAAYSLSYGRSVLDKKLNLGLNLKIINQSIDSVSDTGFAVDFGFNSKISEKISAGLNIQNLGTGLFNKPLPLACRLGLAYNFDNSLYLSGESRFSLTGQETVLFFNAEYLFFKLLAVGLGYKTGNDLGSGISFWSGVKLSRFNIDYAYIPFSILGTAHKVSVGMKLGQRPSEYKLPVKKQEILQPVEKQESIEKSAEITEEEKKIRIRQHFNQGKQYFLEKNYHNSLTEYKKALELDPRHKPSLDNIQRIETLLENNR